MSAEPVKVVCRVRPALSTESMNSKMPTVTPTSITIQNPRHPLETLTYHFDHCFDENDSQTVVFNTCVRSILEKALKGIHITVMAYGNTSAGKTFSMQGTDDHPGIIPQTVKYFIGKGFDLTMSFMEIYNEKVFDLFCNDVQDLPVREDQEKNIIIPGLIKHSIKKFNDFLNLYSTGIRNRSTATTKLNAISSRSHSILLLQLEKEDFCVSKIHLIDLAGSEDNRRTENSGVRLKESGAINKSLFALGQVVDALNQKNLRIPYRDSKLTRILQDSLGGRASSLLLANIAPTEQFLTETHRTLEFASKSKSIVNDIKRSRSSNEHLRPLKRPSSEIDRPEKKLKTLKRPSDTPSLEEQIELKVTQKIKELSQTGKIFSPLVKKQERDVQETHKRLNELEQKLEERLDDIDVVELLTPNTKRKNAKAFIQKAMMEEKNNQIERAILFFEKAHKYCPTEKLEKRISQLKGTDENSSKENLKNPFEDVNEKQQLAQVFEKKIEFENQKKPSLLKRLFPEPLSSIPSSLNLPKSILSIPSNITIKSSSILETLNSGDIKQLKKLAGVGAKRAQMILDYFNEHGPFQELTDLQSVGISKKVIQQWSDEIKI